MYLSYERERGERDRVKNEKLLGWYKRGGYDSVMFIQSSPGSEMKRKFQAEVDRSNLRIRVVEKAGRSIKSALQRSDPFKSTTCGRDTCLVCETGERFMLNEWREL